MTPAKLLLVTWIGGLSACAAIILIAAWYRWQDDGREAENRAHRAAARDWLDSHYREGDRVLWGTVRATVEEVSIDGATVLLATDTGSYEWVRTKDITRIMRAA